jgi:hypothetical protein
MRTMVSQDTFNRLITVAFLSSTMTLVWLSWWTGKPIDITSFLSLLVPVATHISHIIVRSKDHTTDVKNGKTENLHE